MRLFLCTTVLTTALLGALAYPADPSSPQAQKLEKQQRQSLFGVGIDINLSKNGTLIPKPAFMNTSGSYNSGLGAGGNFLVPLVPFPLGLLFPHPPLNITVGFNTNKNISASLVASTGNNNNAIVEEETGSGWGWSTTTTTPAPSGWSWGPLPSIPGWGSPPPPPPTEGWTAPSSTAGWTAPTEASTTPEPETTTTEGWGWVEPTTPGWGWGVKKGLSPNSNAGLNKPQIPSGPKPNSHSKPQQVASPGSLENGKPSEANSSPSYITDVAQSTLSSEIPSVDIPAHAEPLQFTVATDVPPHLLQNQNNSPMNMDIPVLNMAHPVPEPAMEILVADVAPAAAPVPEPLVEVAAVEAIAPEVAEVPAPEAVLENDNVKVSLSISPVASKNKRHAEQPSTLRIEDFEDVESPSDMNIPAIQEQMEQEMSKEEMIILAMEQASQPGSPMVQLGNARPAPLRPTLNQLHNKPIAEFDESDESGSAIDMRNSDSSSAQASENSKPVSKGKPESEPSSPVSGRNKPRPYGMDKPSKSRPTLDSGMKDKTEQFGLPHNYDLQKEQYPIPGGSSASSVLGFQVPDIKWSSFSNILQSFLGSSHKKNSMGKSDADSGKCIDDDDAVSEGVRAHAKKPGQLCQSNKGVNACHTACLGSGFESGNCLGPSIVPGCLCKIPNHKELGMMLSPLKKAPVEEYHEDLQISGSAPCKKCACADSCKGIGSYTGFCLDKCYCAVPWYTKVDN